MIGSMSFWYHACTDACPESGFYDVYAVYVTVFYLLFMVTLVLLYVSKAFVPYAGDWKTRRAVDAVCAGIVSVYYKTVYMKAFVVKYRKPNVNLLKCA